MCYRDISVTEIYVLQRYWCYRDGCPLVDAPPTGSRPFPPTFEGSLASAVDCRGCTQTIVLNDTPPRPPNNACGRTSAIDITIEFYTTTPSQLQPHTPTPTYAATLTHTFTTAKHVPTPTRTYAPTHT